MTNDTTLGDDALDVLVCEYQKRPQGAPSFDDLQHAVRRVRREQGVLAVEYDPAVAAALEELAAAERLCCPSIGFDVTPAPMPTLRITARPAQLDVFEQFLSS
jgi:hypothetical protein